MLPPDSHVHTEWSWDAPRGSMVATCARAVELGLRSVAFTDHADFTRWVDRREHERRFGGPRGTVDDERMFQPAPLDLDGYLESLEECRRRFSELTILSGVELGEPHWHAGDATALIGRGGFDRVLISLHSARARDGRIIQIRDAFAEGDAHDVVRTYLEDAVTMLNGSSIGAVLAHIDYPARAWPRTAGPYAPTLFEGEIRTVLDSLRATGRALEVNTRLPLDPLVLRWWYEQGGELVSFGSDAHDPAAVGRGFRDAASIAESLGFRPGRHPHDFWRR